MTKGNQPGEFGRTAFDHPLVKCNGSPIALNGERVLVPKDCGCPKCVERLARFAKDAAPRIVK